MICEPISETEGSCDQTIYEYKGNNNNEEP